jgi:hypothetical protein
MTIVITNVAQGLATIVVYTTVRIVANLGIGGAGLLPHPLCLLENSRTPVVSAVLIQTTKNRFHGDVFIRNVNRIGCTH